MSEGGSSPPFGVPAAGPAADPPRSMERRSLRGPVLPPLEEIPRTRRALGLSQARLARLAGLSQGAVAKIERGRTRPSYDAVVRLLEALEAERGRRAKEAVVGQVLTARVVSVEPALPLDRAVAEMRRHKFSQLPVLHRGAAVGSLSERVVTDLILAGRRLSDFPRVRVAEVMDPPFPTLDQHAPVHLAAALLQHYPAVLAVSHGQVLGIVTRSDLLKLVSR